MDKKNEKLVKDYENHCLRIKQATSVNIAEPLPEKRKRINKLQGNYAQWFEYYFPMYAKVPCASFHKRMANIIKKNKVCNLLAEIYRSGAKSVHLDMGVPLWLYVTGELKYMLLIGETEPKANKLLSDIQAQLQYNQRFINDCGRKFKYGAWSEGDFTTTDGVKFTAMSIGQSVRGLREASERPDYIVIDDVDNKKRCNNDKLSRDAYEWVWEDLRGCFDESEGSTRRMVVANNNFHKNTVINQLKQEFNRINKEAKEANQEIEHFVVTVKAVKDTINFEPAWPEKTSAEYWRKKFNSTPYRSFMREYMHVHLQDGVIFLHKHIQKCKILSLSKYDGLIVYGDMSYKDNGDFKALPFLGKIGRDFHLIDGLIRQTSRTNCAIWLYELYEDRKLSKVNVRYEIEGLFAQDELVNDFDIEGDNRGYYVPVVADKKPKGNKFERVESMSGFFERGNFWFNEELINGTDFQNLIDQLLAFEKGSGAPDDGPDAVQSGISKLNKSTFVEKFEPIFISRESMRSKNRY